MRRSRIDYVRRALARAESGRMLESWPRSVAQYIEGEPVTDAQSRRYFDSLERFSVEALEVSGVRDVETQSAALEACGPLGAAMARKTLRREDV